MKITTDMIKVKKQFQGKNVMLRGKGKITLSEEVDYNTAQMLIHFGLEKYLVREKIIIHNKVEKPKKTEVKYKAINETKEDGEA